MGFRDLANTLTMLAVTQNGSVIQIKWTAADVSAFELCAPHAGANALDDQVAFKLGDGADDDNDGPTQRAASIDLLSEADDVRRLKGQGSRLPASNIGLTSFRMMGCPPAHQPDLNPARLIGRADEASWPRSWLWQFLSLFLNSDSHGAHRVRSRIS
jgi:hypothetical protein